MQTHSLTVPSFMAEVQSFLVSQEQIENQRRSRPDRQQARNDEALTEEEKIDIAASFR